MTYYGSVLRAIEAAEAHQKRIAALAEKYSFPTNEEALANARAFIEGRRKRVNLPTSPKQPGLF